VPELAFLELILLPTCAKMIEPNARLPQRFIHNSYPQTVDILEYVLWIRKNIFVLPLY